MFPTDLPSDDPWYICYAHSHPVSEVITTGDRDSPYLYRWHIIPKNKLFNIFLHHFVGNDKRYLHDHPWASLAYQLSGSLFEVYSKSRSYTAPVKNRIIKRGKWTYRSAKFMHFLKLPGLIAEPESTWTLFFTGPKFKKWGFITANGWRNNKTVLHHKKGESNG